MTTEIIRVLIDDGDWPQMMCTVQSSNGSIQRQSLYDTAGVNFEPYVLNALRSAVIGIIQKRRTNNGKVSSEAESSGTNEEPIQKGRTEKRTRRSKSQLKQTGDRHSLGKRTKGGTKK